jgi:hypothetical protein
MHEVYGSYLIIGNKRSFLAPEIVSLQMGTDQEEWGARYLITALDFWRNQN